MYFSVEPASQDDIAIMHIYTMALPFAVYSMCSMAFLQALKKVKVAAKAQGLIRVSFAVLAVLGGYWGGLDYVIFLTVIGYIAASICLYFLLRNTTYDDPFLTEFSEDANRFKLHSLGMLATGGLTVLQQNIDLYLLGIFRADYQLIADFGLASILFTAGVLVTGTIQTVLTPYLSEKQDDLLWVREKTTRLQVLLIPFSFLFGLFLYAGVSGLVYFGFFPDYPNLLNFSIPMIIKYWIWSLFCVFGAALFAIGIVKETLIFGSIVVLFNVVLSTTALYLYGPEYIIYCQPIVVCAQLIAVIYIFNKKTKAVSA
jgi:O-antigen/teichoic acid export membrane protein